MATQQALAVIDALTTAWDAAPTLDGVVVSKGWEILATGDKEHVFVGGDGGADVGNEDIIRSTIEWPGMSPTSRIENGTIDCAASVWTGDESAIDATITRTYAIVGACEDVLRANPSLGSPIALQAKIVETRLRNVQDAEGYLVIVTFLVSYQSSV